MVRRALIVAVAAFSLGAGVMGPASAGSGNPNGTGQPSQSCEDPGMTTPSSQTMSAPGSAFNPDGQAGMVYAGEQPQNSNNPTSVSQYDVACYQTTNH